MTPVCGKCGDTGYAEILVCCFMCRDAYEHRYCFNKASDIFREDVKWACEDCLPTIPNTPTPKKNRNLPSTPSRRSERISSRNLPASNASVAAKPAVEISPPNAKRTKRRSECSDEMECLELPNMDGSPECNQRISCILEKNENKDIQTPEIEGKVTELVTESLSNEEEVKGLLGGTLWIDLSGHGSPTFDDNQSFMSHQNHNCHARPIMDPVWKGSFRICYKKFSRIEAVAAHLSTLACPKAQQEARLLPVALHLRIVPRSIVWPKSFQKAEPKDDSIGLYFFPEMDRDGKTFDSLVDGMISEDLAMICVVENAELLVFTSVKLPCDYWRFQGRRYLWGVFRAKQTLPSSQFSKQRA